MHRIGFGAAVGGGEAGVAGPHLKNAPCSSRQYLQRFVAPQRSSALEGFSCFRDHGPSHLVLEWAPRLGGGQHPWLGHELQILVGKVQRHIMGALCSQPEMRQLCFTAISEGV